MKTVQRERVDMPAQITINTWILPENLPLFLARMYTFIGYNFEEWDWDAIRFGIRDTNIQQGRWYKYSLSAKPPVELSFAGAEDAKRLHVKVETEDSTAVG